MKIIVGLGNPGSQYLLTRHNLGFMLIDSLCDREAFKKKHKSLIQKIPLAGESVLLVKPQTYMNLSGVAVQEILSFYKSSLEDLMVVHDDKDLSFGSMKLQKSRGHGGHNGIRNIHQCLNSSDYCRLKMGVAPAKVEDSDKGTASLVKTSNWVLSNFNPQEQKQVSEFFKPSLSGFRAMA